MKQRKWQKSGSRRNVADPFFTVTGACRRLYARVREIFPNAFLGKDGKSVELMFEDEKIERGFI